MTVYDCLRGLNAYPIPATAIREIAINRGVYVDDEATAEMLASTEYIGAKADVLMWLAQAPNVSQGGQNYSFSEFERKALRASASALYDQVGEDAKSGAVVYGYKGSRL